MIHPKKRVLVVEDDKHSLQTLCLILEKLNLEPVPFPQADGVMEQIKGTKLHLALLDVMMPGMSGYDLLQELKESEEFSSLPVMIVTARDTEADTVEGYKYGADYYLSKPFSIDQLREGIRLFIKE